MRVFTILLITLTLFGCNKGTPTEPAKAVSDAPKTEPAKTVSDTPKDGGIKYGEAMTTEEMDKLMEGRKDMINRPTPLGEEKDAVEALRKQAAEK